MPPIKPSKSFDLAELRARTAVVIAKIDGDAAIALALAGKQKDKEASDAGATPKGVREEIAHPPPFEGPSAPFWNAQPIGEGEPIYKTSPAPHLPDIPTREAVGFPPEACVVEACCTRCDRRSGCVGGLGCCLIGIEQRTGVPRGVLAGLGYGGRGQSMLAGRGELGAINKNAISAEVERRMADDEAFIASIADIENVPSDAEAYVSILSQFADDMQPVSAGHILSPNTLMMALREGLDLNSPVNRDIAAALAASPYRLAASGRRLLQHIGEIFSTWPETFPSGGWDVSLGAGANTDKDQAKEKNGAALKILVERLREAVARITMRFVKPQSVMGYEIPGADLDALIKRYQDDRRSFYSRTLTDVATFNDPERWCADAGIADKFQNPGKYIYQCTALGRGLQTAGKVAAGVAIGAVALALWKGYRFLAR